jgi:serine/threonine-protein kinase
MRLGTRLFLLSSLLVLLAVAGALAFGSIRTAQVARQSVVDGLEQGVLVLENEERARYERMQLLANVFVADANLIAYLAEATARGETRSILDILLERQVDIGFDFAVVTDPDGVVLARTDRLRAAGSSVAGTALFARALDELQAAGVWVEDGALYHAVAIPLVQGLDLLGYFALAYSIDEETAREGQRLADAGVSYFGFASERLSQVATSLEERSARRLAGIVAARSELAAAAREGREVVPVELDLGGEDWVGHLSPLRDAQGEPVGAVLGALPLGERLLPFRRIGLGMAVSGLVAVVLVSGLTYVLATRSMRPVRDLVAATAAARAGQYDRALPAGRRDEIGQLATSFDALLDELRERRDMEQYVAQLQRNLPEGGAPAVAASHAELHETVLLGLDFRRHGRAVKAADATLEDLGRELARAREAAQRGAGRVLGHAGHRLWLSFDGADGAMRAVATAVDLVTVLRARGAEDVALPLQVIAAGPVAVGAHTDTAGGTQGFAGRPVAMVESLMREAVPGELLLDQRTFELLRETTERLGVRPVDCRGVATPLRFWLLRLEDAQRVASSLDRVAAPAAIPTVDLRPGSVIGERYEILAELGSGGMGVVYKARDRELDDVVALKLLRPSQWRDRETFERVKRELKLARMITHPNVLRVYDLGEVQGTPFLSMEYVRGITLRDLLRGSDRVPYAAALRIARQICQGLAAVHHAGVVHCDLKPENVILAPNGNARLMDFGIAQPERALRSESGRQSSLQGTPRYLAPEQLETGGSDVRSDIHACGLVLYELFTGHFPYPDAANVYTAIRVLREMEPTPASAHWPEIPPALEQILMRCLRKDPRERFQTADELLAELDSAAVKRARGGVGGVA